MLGAVLGALAAGCSVGLLATAAWLISRSALRPQVLFLVTPAAVVEAFGFGRAVFRYAERLAGHDAALTLLAARRVRAYDALARLAPTGIADYGSGDLSARLVADIDHWPTDGSGCGCPTPPPRSPARARLRWSRACSRRRGYPRGDLVVSAFAAPAAASRSPPGGTQPRPLRGELAAATLALLDSAAELTAFSRGGRGARRRAGQGRSRWERQMPLGIWAREPRPPSARSRPERRCSARSPSPFSRSRRRPGRRAARGLVLTPLAAHEVFAGLGQAAQEIPASRVRRPGRGVFAWPAPVAEPFARKPLPDGLTTWRARPHRRLDAGEPASATFASISGRVQARDRRPLRSGNTTLAMVLSASSLQQRREARRGWRSRNPDPQRHPHRGLRLRRPAHVVGLCEQDAHGSTPPSGRTCGSRSRTRRRASSATRWPARDFAWTESLPQGLSTRSARRARLSGGQRQRLALARVLLADFPVVTSTSLPSTDEEAADGLTHDLLAAVAGGRSCVSPIARLIPQPLTRCAA